MSFDLTNTKTTTETNAVNKLSAKLLSIHRFMVTENENIIAIINPKIGLLRYKPILSEEYIMQNKDKNGTTSIPLIPNIFTKGTDKNGYSILEL